MFCVGAPDSKIAPAQLDIAFTQDQLELKKSFEGFSFESVRAGSYTCNVTPFGLSQVRVQTEGEGVIGSIALDAIPGEAVPDKLKNLTTMVCADFVKLIPSKASLVKVKEGDVLAIPAGRLVMCVPMGDDARFTCIHWMTYREADKGAVVTTLGDLMRAHPYLAETDYKVIHDIVQASESA